MYKAICDAIHRELETLDEKYSKGAQMSGSELDAIDKMVHTLKSLKTYEAMEDGYTRGRRYSDYDTREYRRY